MNNTSLAKKTHAITENSNCCMVPSCISGELSSSAHYRRDLCLQVHFTHSLPRTHPGLGHHPHCCASQTFIKASVRILCPASIPHLVSQPLLLLSIFLTSPSPWPHPIPKPGVKHHEPTFNHFLTAHTHSYFSS